jgi:hypothetical protein
LTDALKPPVSADAITSRDDRFHCTPLSVTLLANGCVRRQAMVRAGIRALEMHMCKGCALGAIVERNSGGPVPVSEVARKAASRPGAALKNTPSFDDSMGASKYAPKPPKPKKSMLTVVDGGLKFPERATLPTMGAELAIPKAPPGRPVPTFPESANPSRAGLPPSSVVNRHAAPR